MMKSTQTKRVLSLLLSLCLIVGMFPTTGVVAKAAGNVAKINGTEYATVQAAITAASNGDVITMIAHATENITVAWGKNVTLDLNGYVLKGKGDSSVITNNGNLTIVDSNTGSQTHKFDKSNDLWTLAADSAKGDDIVTVTGGVITGGNAYTGGGVYNNSGKATLTITGGNITGNTADTGGGVYISSGTLNITGGNITGNTALFGGGVYISSGTLNITGGNITGNTATYGGGVFNSSTLTLTGGNITGNTATYGGGVYSRYDKKLTITGGNITGNTADTGGGVYNDGTLNITGGVFQESVAATLPAETEGIAGGLYIVGQNVGVDNGNVTGGTFTFDPSDYVADGYAATEIADGLYIVGQNVGVDANGNVTSGTFTFDPSDYVADGYAATENNGTWTVAKKKVAQVGEDKYKTIAAALEGASQNSANPTKIQLIADVCENVTIAAGTYVELDLNGFVLKGDGNFCVIWNKGNLTITDSSVGEGKTPTVRYFTDEKCAHGVAIGEDCETCGDGVAVTDGCYETYTTEKPENTTGVLTVTGGVITGGKKETGGGMCNDGTLMFNGGTIIGNYAEDSCGGVFNFTTGTLTMNGGVITGNTASIGGGVYNYYGELTINGGDIKGNTATSSGGGVYNYKGTLTIKSGNITGNTARWGGGVNNYGTLNINGGDIKDNTATSSGGGVYNNGTLNITGGDIKGNNASYGGGIINWSTLTITGGTITGNNASSGGGGILLEAGTFEMNGENAIITGCSAKFGGGLYIKNDSTANLIKGSITYNSSSADTNEDGGGGVYLWGSTNGTCNIYKDFTISHNEAVRGGGIYNDSGVVNMNDGTISENTASKEGGGVFSKGTVNITDGNITGNTATTSGGGVYNLFGALTITGGNITGNTATSDGGGVFNGDGTLTISNTAITSNSAGIEGGGIANFGILKLNDGTEITDNTSDKTYLAGGVYYWYKSGRSVDISGKVIIKNNTTNGTPANLCLSNNGQATLGTLASGTEIGVAYLDNSDALISGAFTTNGTADDLQYFTSDSGAYVLKFVEAVEASGEKEAVAAHLELVDKGTHHEAVDATCGTDGNIEYWECDEKFYTDAECTNEISYAETIIKATGKHTYSLSWSWTKQGSNDWTAKCIATCSVCGAVTEAKAEVSYKSGDTADTADTADTYTASVKIDGKAYTATKEIAKTTYTVTLDGKSYVKGNYTYGEKVTISKEKACNWTYNGQVVKKNAKSYSFIVTENTTLTTVESTQEAPILAIYDSGRIMKDGGKSKVTLTVKWNLPEGCTMVSAGIERGYGANAETDATNLSTTNTSTLKTLEGTFIYTVNMGVNATKRCLTARGYLKYKDQNGVEQIMRTEEVSVKGS